MLKELTVVWLGRVVSMELLSDIIYVLLQDRNQGRTLRNKEDCLLEGKTKEFLEKVSKFVGCYCSIPEPAIRPECIKLEH